MSKVVFTEKGWEHYQYWLAQNRKIMQKIARLVYRVGQDQIVIEACLGHYEDK